MNKSKLFLSSIVVMSLFLSSCGADGGGVSVEPASNTPASIHTHSEEDHSGHSHNEGSEVSSASSHTHDYQLVETVNPTYESYGYKKYQCKCGESYLEYIDPLEHHYHNYYSPVDDFDHAYFCSDSGYTHLYTNPVPHSYSEWHVEVEPTEYEEGLRWACCDVCGYRHEEYMPTIDHVHVMGDEGWHYDEEAHWHECKNCFESYDIAEHDFEWIVDQEPQEAREGVGHNHCKICGYDADNETIPALPHNEHTPCDSYEYDDTHHYLYCKYCGELLESEEHTLGEETLVKAGTCSSPNIVTKRHCSVCDNDIYYYGTHVSNIGDNFELHNIQVDYNDSEPYFTATLKATCLDCGEVIERTINSNQTNIISSYTSYLSTADFAHAGQYDAIIYGSAVVSGSYDNNPSIYNINYTGYNVRDNDEDTFNAGLQRLLYDQDNFPDRYKNSDVKVTAYYYEGVLLGFIFGYQKVNMSTYEVQAGQLVLNRYGEILMRMYMYGNQNHGSTTIYAARMFDTVEEYDALLATDPDIKVTIASPIEFEDYYRYDELTHYHQSVDSYDSRYFRKDVGDHEFVDNIIEPTFESGGYTNHKCSVCGYEYNDSYTDKLEHSYDETKWLSDENTHWHACLDEGYEDLKGHETSHTFIDKEYVAATFEADGYHEQFCDVCGHIKHEVLPQIPHTYDLDNWSYDNTQHYHACLDEGYLDTYIDEAHHSFVETVVAPTIKEDGYTLHKCSVCGYEYRDTQTLSKYHESLPYLSFTLSRSGDKYEVSEIRNGKKDIYIPDTYEGLPVTSIGYSAAKNNNTMMYLYLGDNITAISGDTFSGNTSLVQVRLGKAFNSNSASMFSGAYRLVEFINESESTLNFSSLSRYILGIVNSAAESKLYEDENGMVLYKKDSDTYFIYDPNHSPMLVVPEGVTKLGPRVFYNDKVVYQLTLPSTYKTSLSSDCFFNSVLVEIISPNNFYNPMSGRVEVIKPDATPSVSMSEDSIIQTTASGINLLKYNGGATTYVIPDNTYKISAYAFDGNETITTLTIGEDVTNIDSMSFSNMKELTAVNYLAINAILNGSPFTNDTNLTTFNLGDKVTNIPSNLCASLPISTISIPDTVTSIGYAAFDSCKNLTSVVIPESVTNIEQKAFNGCSSLTSVNIPSGVTYIPDYMLYGTSKLETLTLHDGITGFGNYSLCRSGLTTITLPASLVNIATSAFSYSSITTVNFPAGVKSIGASAFDNCQNLTSVTLPDNIETIGSNAFRYTNINYTEYEGGKYIPSATNPYMYLGEVKAVDGNITFAPGVRFIGGSGISSIKLEIELVVPEGVTTMASNAIEYCNFTSITLPKSLKYISSGFINSCSKLTTVTFNSEELVFSTSYNGPITNANNLTTIIFGDDATIVPSYLTKGLKGFTTVVLGNNIKTIGGHAFENVTAITSITLPSSLEVIEENAFAGTGLTSITLNEGLKIIKYRSFYNTPIAGSVTLPKSLEIIYSDAFAACRGITEVTVNSEHLTANTYNGANNSPFNGCQIASIHLGKDVKVISDNFAKKLTTLIIVDADPECALEVVGVSSFDSCTNLTTFPFLDSITTIKDYAFIKCSSLSIVSLSKNLTTIGSRVFENCSGIKSLSYDVAIEVAVSFSNSSITSLTIGEHVTVIPSSFVYGNPISSSIVLNEGITKIGSGAFGNTGITSVTIPSTVTSLGYNAFASCSSLENIYFNAKHAESTREISSGPFYGVSGVSNLILGDTVEYVEMYLFNNMGTINYIEIGKGITYISEAAFNKVTANKVVVKSNLNNEHYFQSFTAYEVIYSDDVTAITNKMSNAMTSVTIGKNVASIGNNAFTNTKLQVVNYNAIDCAVTADILRAPFQEITTIREINIGKDVAKLYSYIFACDSESTLSSYDYDGDSADWANIELQDNWNIIGRFGHGIKTINATDGVINL